MPRKNIHLSDSVEKRVSELIQSGVADGLSDLITRLVREEFERRFSINGSTVILREKIDSSGSRIGESFAEDGSEDDERKTEMMRFRCSLELKRRFEKIAKSERRELSDLARIIIEDYIAEHKARENNVSIK